MVRSRVDLQAMLAAERAGDFLGVGARHDAIRIAVGKKRRARDSLAGADHVERFDVVEKRALQAHAAERQDSLGPPALELGRAEFGDRSYGVSDRSDRDEREDTALLGREQQRDGSPHARAENSDRPTDSPAEEIPSAGEIVDFAAKRQVSEGAFGLTDVGKVEAKHRKPGARQSARKELVLRSVLRRFHALAENHAGSDGRGTFAARA